MVNSREAMTFMILARIGVMGSSEHFFNGTGTLVFYFRNLYCPEVLAVDSYCHTDYLVWDCLVDL